jgi:murein DD-endopeptidase MepM/ murein hydrolase activator NlpD
MRNPVFAFGSRPVVQAALVVLLAGISASCSNSLRLKEPFFTGSTENQREILGTNTGGDDSFQAMPNRVASNAVSRSDLPPPPDYGQPEQQAYAPAEPVDDYSDTAAPVDGTYGFTAVGGRVITVARNEDLDTLTARFGVPQEQILNANQLKSASQIRPGKVLVIPRRIAMAPDSLKPTNVATYDQPAEEIAPTPRMLASNASTYVVQPGDTLFGVARKSGMKATEIAALNGFTTDTQLRSGQTLRLNGRAPKEMVAVNEPRMLGAPEKPLGTLVVNKGPKIRLTSPAETAETGQLVMAAPKVPEMPSIPVERRVDAPTTTVAANAIDDAADAASTDGKSFRWPVRGRIISGFGSKPNGERNDGINLAVPEGTSVKAVETGTVIYAGNELEGYGNLVLVRHADGWVSAYAHNKDLLVKRGDQVRRGQTVAHAGMSGSVSAPQVHFELRKGAKPVNPLDYLAGA